MDICYLRFCGSGPQDWLSWVVLAPGLSGGYSPGVTWAAVTWGWRICFQAPSRGCWWVTPALGCVGFSVYRLSILTTQPRASPRGRAWTERKREGCAARQSQKDVPEATGHRRPSREGGRWGPRWRLATPPQHRLPRLGVGASSASEPFHS